MSLPYLPPDPSSRSPIEIPAPVRAQVFSALWFALRHPFFTLRHTLTWFSALFRLSPAARLARLDPRPPLPPSSPFVGYKRGFLWVGFTPSSPPPALSLPSAGGMSGSERQRFGPLSRLSDLSDPLGDVLAGTSAAHSAIFRFRGMAHPISYGLLEAARCGRAAVDDPEHLPPQKGCSCGFHALISRERIAALQFSGAAAGPRVSSVLLEVAAFGDVVVGETGFRFSHQQVRRVELEPWCSWCGRPARAAGISRQVLESLVAPTYPVVSACRRHVPRFAARLSPDELSRLVGVPVSFGDQLPASAIWGVSPEVAFFERLAARFRRRSDISQFSYRLLRLSSGPAAWYPPTWVWKLSRRFPHLPPRLLYRLCRLVVWSAVAAAMVVGFLSI